MGHLTIFIYLAALLLGGGASVSAGRLRRTNPEPFLGPLFSFTLFFNLVILSVFSTNYAQTNITVPYDERTLPVILWVFGNNFGGFVALSGLLFTFPAVFRGFEGRPLSLPLRRFLFAGISLFLVGYIAGFALFLYRVANPWLDVSRNIFNGLCLLFLWGTAVFHWFRRSKNPIVIAQAQVRLFNGLYLAAFSLFFILALLPYLHKMLLISFLMLGLSGIPLFWLRFAYSRGGRDGASGFFGLSGLEDIAARHGLSAREKEILKLLLEGRSNSEIGKSLFISTGTVKNHVTGIFKKMGIARRGQLMRFIREKRL